MSKIQLLMVTSGATAGGAERQLIYFLKHYDRARFECRLLTVLASDSAKRCGGDDFRPTVEALGVPLVSLNLSRFPTVSGVWKLYRTIAKLPGQIIQTYGLAVDLALRISASNDRILVGSMRGSEDQRPNWLFRLDGFTGRRRLRGYISNSSAGRDALVTRARVKPECVEVIPNGIQADEFAACAGPEARHVLRNELSINTDEFVVLTVANLHEAKRHCDIIAAAARMKCLARVRFIFAGEDRSGGDLKRLADQLGVRDRIAFVGHRKDVARLMAASDILLLASIREGMPNAVMEAMSMRLPIVATDVGDASELLDGGNCGQIIAPRSPDEICTAIQRYVENAELRRLHGGRAGERIRHYYGIERMVRKHEEYYASLVKI